MNSYIVYGRSFKHCPCTCVWCHHDLTFQQLRFSRIRSFRCTTPIGFTFCWMKVPAGIVLKCFGFGKEKFRDYFSHTQVACRCFVSRDCSWLFSYSLTTAPMLNLNGNWFRHTFFLALVRQSEIPKVKCKSYQNTVNANFHTFMKSAWKRRSNWSTILDYWHTKACLSNIRHQINLAHLSNSSNQHVVADTNPLLRIHTKTFAVLKKTVTKDAADREHSAGHCAWANWNRQKRYNTFIWVSFLHNRNFKYEWGRLGTLFSLVLTLYSRCWRKLATTWVGNSFVGK